MWVLSDELITGERSPKGATQNHLARQAVACDSDV